MAIDPGGSPRYKALVQQDSVLITRAKQFQKRRHRYKLIMYAKEILYTSYIIFARWQHASQS